MLSDERIDEIAKPFAGMGGVEQYREFANAIEREATAPLIEQIKEDEALMRQALTHFEFIEGCNGVAILDPIGLSEMLLALRQRLEAKK